MAFQHLLASRQIPDSSKDAFSSHLLRFDDGKFYESFAQSSGLANGISNVAISRESPILKKTISGGDRF